MSSQCKCSMAIKILGDGCEVCNPELAEEIRAENAQELDGEPVGEMVGHHRVGMGEMPTIKWRDGYWPMIGTKFYAEPPKCARCAELEEKLKSDGRMIDNYIGHVATQKAVNEELQAKLAAAEKDAERFEALQNMPIEQAQAFFWNFSSRTERAKAIDSAIAEYKKGETA